MTEESNRQHVLDFLNVVYSGDVEAGTSRRERESRLTAMAGPGGALPGRTPRPDVTPVAVWPGPRLGAGCVPPTAFDAGGPRA